VVGYVCREKGSGLRVEINPGFGMCAGEGIVGSVMLLRCCCAIEWCCAVCQAPLMHSHPVPWLYGNIRNTLESCAVT